MYANLSLLQSFYASAIGQKTAGELAEEIEKIGPTFQDLSVVGLGYCAPYLDRLTEKSAYAFSFMPAQQGAQIWCRAGVSASALVCEESLPLADCCMDVVLLMHSLEFSKNPRKMLEEVWRILVPGGSVFMVVPNRLGLWARNERTPFGYGLPYSKRQLHSLLENCHFSLETLRFALYFLSSYTPVTGWGARFFQSSLQRLFPYFGGVLLLKAKKDLYKPLTVKEKNRGLVFMPELDLRPSISREG